MRPLKKIYIKKLKVNDDWLESFNRIFLPLSVRQYANTTIANDLVPVQPLSPPTGEFLFLNFKYDVEFTILKIKVNFKEKNGSKNKN